MPICIRNNVFETNSSSCHSLAIFPSRKEYQGFGSGLTYNTNLDIELQEYGRDFDILASSRSKLNYLMTLAYSNSSLFNNPIHTNGTLSELFSEMLRDTSFDKTFPEFQLIFNYLRKLGLKHITVYSEGFPQVDHQSRIPVEEFLCGIPVEDFINEEQYVIVLYADG